MSRADGLALAKDAFGDVFRAPVFVSHALPTGMRVKQFLGDAGAVLEAPTTATTGWLSRWVSR
jgi:hypothetical protein